MSRLSPKYQIVVKSNKSGDNFDDLTSMPNFHWLDKAYGLGFGNNNNVVFDFCRTELSMKEDDYFILLNPDVIVDSNDLDLLVSKMKLSESKISTINLYNDYERTIFDNSIRKFPSFIQFSKSFLGLGNSAIIDKDEIKSPCYVDWAAGSFLAFEAHHYCILNGFDEKYFMYCEDIDICYRSHLIGERVTYFPEIKAVHLAKHANRNLFSKHFYWHVTSVIRFLLTKIGLTKPSSSLS
ncbi:glycosyltransferase family protein [Shewanella algae]|uniref:glycosyltransferase family 2 protein n=1 Tax=Shewanella algae TaxID=38313 RepID=UPI001C90D18D|nr:glycosyltransferase family 2 protein [Shewanella algae]